MLSVGGVLQGLALLDPARDFIESVKVTMPWLQGRSLGGALMTCGHLVFAVHVLLIAVRSGAFSVVERPAAVPTSIA